MEIEAKFTIPDRATFERLLALTALGPYELRPAGEQDLVDRYYDTAVRDVWRGGYALRLREDTGRGRWRGTVKGLGGAQGAVHRREEHEVDVPPGSLPATWPSSPARELALRLAGEADLGEMFAVGQRRMKREVWEAKGMRGLRGIRGGDSGDSGEGPEGSQGSKGSDEAAEARLVGEMSLDEVRLAREGRELPGFELELELGPDGTPEDLDALEAALAGLGLRPEGRSKFERGLELVDAGPNREGATDGRGSPGEDGQLTAEDAELGDGVAAPFMGASPAAERAELGVDEHEPLTTEDAERAELGDGVAAPFTGASPVAEDAEPGEPPAPRRAKSPGVRADEPMAEAGRKVLRFHFARMTAQEDGARLGEDIEAVHDMRVATRRQRAALALFAGYFKPKALRPINQALKATARRLGAVRDLDVQLEAARAYQAGLSEAGARALQPVLEAWAAERDAARAALVGHLDSADYQRFKEKYAGFLDTDWAGVVKPTGEGPQPALVRDLLPARLWEHYGAVRAYAAALPGAPIETLHALRITGKRLRYALEFFAEALDPSLREAIKSVVALQDHLGELNDADVTLARLHAYLQSADPRPAPETVLAVGGYLRIQQNRLRALQRTVGRPWRAIVGVRFRRLLARAVAGL